MTGRGNIGDYGKDGNTSYDQGNTHNLDNRQKPGTMNTNYHSMPNYSTNIGTLTGTTNTLNEMVEKKLNSSRGRPALRRGVMLRFIHFFPLSYLIHHSGPTGLSMIETTE